MDARQLRHRRRERVVAVPERRVARELAVEAAQVGEQVPHPDVVGPDPGRGVEVEQACGERRRQRLRHRGDRKRASSSQPIACSSVVPSGPAIPSASAGTSKRAAASSQARKNVESNTNPLPYSATRPRPRASSFAACWGPGRHIHVRRQMTLTKEEKQVHIGKFGKHETDTGSPEVQIAMLTPAHQRAHGASPHAQARSLLAPRPAQARRASPALPQLPAAERRRGLPGPHQGARPAPLALRFTEGGSLSELLDRGADSNLHPSQLLGTAKRTVEE